MKVQARITDSIPKRAISGKTPSPFSIMSKSLIRELEYSEGLIESYHEEGALSTRLKAIFLHSFAWIDPSKPADV